MHKTLVDLFWQQVARSGDRVALRRWRQGTAQDTSWRQYGDAVRRAVGGFLHLTLRPDERVGILATNRPEWLFADLAILSCGAASVPIYPTLVNSQTQHVVAHAQLRLIVVENAAQRDKIRAVRAACPHLQHVIVMEGEADPAHQEITWEAFCAAGDAHMEMYPGAFVAACAQVSASRVATVVYTSGTTGPPKGAMLSHANLLFEAQSVLQYVRLTADDSTLSFLPLSHIAERLQGEIFAIVAGMTVNFAESMLTVRDDLVASRPTLLVCVPRLWEKFHAGILARLAQATPARRAVFMWAERIGRACFCDALRGGVCRPGYRRKRDSPTAWWAARCGLVWGSTVCAMRSVVRRRWDKICRLFSRRLVCR